jgi:6-pyruvoyltetrahydropterin/6-carboxytetrahydropterin synthase
MHFVGTAVDVRALHVMPDVEGPESELHAHDYRIEVVVERERLDERGMVCDLDVLDAVLADTADFVRDKDLEVIRPSDAIAVTVEVFARWAFDRLAAALGDTGAEQLTVRIWESQVAHGGYRGPIRPS